METTSWSIGALAQAAGVSVRTLRHYDQIGLLCPAGRSTGDHRRYREPDVRRLYQILALRSLGFGLEAIGGLLDGAEPRPLADIVREQRDRIQGDLERSHRLRRSLDTLLTTLAAAHQPTPEDLLQTMELITMPEISPAWLTTLLRRSGRLTHGAVTACEPEPVPAQSSHITRLHLTYSPGTPADLPPTLILKRNGSPAWAVQAGAEEVRFYRTVTGMADHPRLVPDCYAALHEAVTGDSYLLLADLAGTHRPATENRDAQVAGDIPDEPTIESVVDSLAELHAYWWDHPLLRDGIFPLLDWDGDPTRFREYLEHRGRSWKALSAQLPTEVAGLLQSVFDGLPTHWDTYLSDRVAVRRNLTLMHGDSYFANFLAPRPGVDAPAYLIDWQCPTVNLGAHDLVNLCATFWTSEQRQENDREQRILRRYHRGLLGHGVTGYSWEELCEDYRSGIVYWLLVPIQDAYGGAARDYWWPKLQCLIAAYHDWDAGQLLTVRDARG